MGRGVGRVGELVGLAGARDLAGEAVGHRVVALWRFVRDGGGREDDLGAVGLEQRDLLLAHLIGHHEDALVALDAGGLRQARAGVAGGGLDDGAAGLEQAGLLGRLDHADADAILDRAAGLEVLGLAQDGRAHAAPDAAQADERAVADGVQNRIIHLHGSRPPCYVLVLSSL